jgi:hypothetical protein
MGGARCSSPMNRWCRHLVDNTDGQVLDASRCEYRAVAHRILVSVMPDGDTPCEVAPFTGAGVQQASLRRHSLTRAHSGLQAAHNARWQCDRCLFRLGDFIGIEGRPHRRASRPRECAVAGASYPRRVVRATRRGAPPSLRRFQRNVAGDHARHRAPMLPVFPVSTDHRAGSGAHPARRAGPQRDCGVSDRLDCDDFFGNFSTAVVV